MSATDSKRGWHALAMTCPNCTGPDPDCDTCNGSGIYQNSHVVNDGLFIAGQCVAKVEAFDDDGPWYANAITLDGEMRRSGPRVSHSAAAEWCEQIAGVVPSEGGREVGP